jgi:hypothetical protein
MLDERELRERRIVSVHGPGSRVKQDDTDIPFGLRAGVAEERCWGFFFLAGFRFLEP